MASLQKAKLQMKADIITSRKLLAQSRRFGFKYTNLVNDALYANMATTTQGYTAQMTKDQNRQLAALRRLQARSNAKGTAIADKVPLTVANRYGSAVAGGADFTGVNAQVRANAIAQRGITGGGKLLASGNAAAAATMAGGLAQAQEASKYATAQALEYRAKNDAQLIAEKQWALHSMILENKLDLQNFRKKQEILAGIENTANLPGMSAVATTAGTSFAGLRRIYNSYIDANGNAYSPSEVETVDGVPTVDGQPVHVPNASEAAAAYFLQNGIMDPNQQALIQGVASAMFNAGIGKGPGTFNQDTEEFAVNAVSQQMSMLYPQYSKYQKEIEDTLRSSIAWQYSDTAVGAVQRGEEVGDDNPWYDTAIKIALPTIGGIVGSVVPGVGTAVGAAIGGAIGGAIAGGITTLDNPGPESVGEVVGAVVKEGITAGVFAGGFAVAGHVARGAVGAVAGTGVGQRLVGWMGNSGLFWKAASKGGAELTEAEAKAVGSAVAADAGSVLGAEANAARSTVAEAAGIVLGPKAGLPAVGQTANLGAATGRTAAVAERAAAAEAASVVGPSGRVIPLAAEAKPPIALGPSFFEGGAKTGTRALLASNPEARVQALLTEPNFVRLADRLGQPSLPLARLVIGAAMNRGGAADVQLTRLLAEQLGMKTDAFSYVLRWVLRGTEV